MANAATNPPFSAIVPSLMHQAGSVGRFAQSSLVLFRKGFADASTNQSKRVAKLMNPEQKYSVANWSGARPPAVLEDAPSLRSPNARLMGFVGTWILHLGILLTVLQTHTAPKVPRTRPDVEAESVVSSNLMMLDPLPSASRSQVTVSFFSSLSRPPRPIFPELSEILLANDLLSDKEGALRIDESASNASKVKWAEIYSGQIRARVERLWRRPRTPVEELSSTNLGPNAGKTFVCEVQIIQNTLGYVEKTLLLSCNGSAAWKASLVGAIQQSSPLPAPPDNSVFNRSVTLVFIAYSYQQGSAPDEYESERAAK